MTDRPSISQWAEKDRPREKLESLGADKLSDAELLAILIGSGSARESAVDLMNRVLRDCGNSLSTLGKMPLHRLRQYNGIGTAKAVSILAACEIGKRRQREKPADRVRIKTSADVYEQMHTRLQDKDTEEAWIMLLNHANMLIRTMCISHGGFTDTTVDVRIIIREALLCNATVIVLCHNHPSGSVRPGTEDRRLTANVAAACRTMRMTLLDHLVITDGQYYSFRDNGEL